jgi:hypothetical protein
MKRILTAAALLAFGLAAGVPARAELKPTTLDKPVPANVTLVEKAEKVGGTLTKFDAESLTIKTTKGDRELKWEDLTPPSRYVLRSKVIDPKSAADWLDQAELAMQCDMREQAKTAVSNAFRIDPSSKLKGDAILRGQGAAKPAVANANVAAPDKPATGAAAAAAATSPTGPAKPAASPKYQKSTPEEDAKAIADATKAADEVADKMKIKFAQFQTAHFLIITDWDPREYDFLKTNCEAAYSAVSKQFDIPVKENIFIGKLPIYMFSKQADFMKFSATLDGFPAGRNVLGYYSSRTDGIGHMVMWKPDTSRAANIREAERNWAYTLTHEFTHAFISRYKTDRRIPRWLNEGTAEVIAYGQFPKPEAHRYARMMAGEDFTFENLFNDNMMPGGEMYPVMQTMVEALIKESRKGFLAMFDDIKEGMDPEEAMKKHYKAGYRQWEPAWRRYAKSLRD